MNTAQRNIEALKDIRSMMERSSRFISLSGWSGISAGLFALAGVWLANSHIKEYYATYDAQTSCASCLKNDLMLIAAGVFVTAFISAALFTFAKSKKQGVAIWGATARRLLWNTLLPMLAGAIVIWRMMQTSEYDLIIPSTLVFYGLALINGSKYTMGEIRFLGYLELITGLVAFYAADGWHIWLWAFGFGVLHIFYGVAMYWKYERKNADDIG